MSNLNNYKKVQIILLILIIIAFIMFIMTFVNKKQKTEIAEPTISEAVTAPVEELSQEEEKTTENTSEEEDAIENPEDTSWDEDAEETKVENPEEEEKNSKETYFIKVNYGANVVTIYKKDKSGKYTVPVKAMVCSTGKATPTSGTYKMSNKYRWHQLNGGVYGQYCSRITGHILFHSVPYATNSPDTLKYIAYDKLGTKASAGCIRLTVADAYWIYSNCASGTYVEFYSSSDPGPLGKPSAQKISSNEKCRNWDPTDPLPNNPWKGYTEPASSTVVEQPKNDSKNEENKSNENTKPQEPQKPAEPDRNNTSNKNNTNTNSNTLGSDNTNTNSNTSGSDNTNISGNNTSSNNVIGNINRENKTESNNKGEDVTSK